MESSACCLVNGVKLIETIFTAPLWVMTPSLIAFGLWCWSGAYASILTIDFKRGPGS
jgi:hypothetical protein